MNLMGLFSKSKIEVSIVKENENGLIFHIKNGKGLLCGKYGVLEGKGFYTLAYDNIPLIKFYGDEYFCPTCEKLVSAGFGLNTANDKTVYEMSNALNKPFESIQKSFECLKPLLGLLSTGYYMLSDKEVLPTDGNGKFFWSIGNTPEANRATAPVYDNSSYYLSHATVKYLLPTQSPKLFNPDRIAHYLKQDNTRAIAYALPNGYLCALMDGHHKACAAALQKKPLKTLVIEPPIGLSYPHQSNGNRGFIYFSQGKVYEDEMKESFEEASKSFASDVRLSNDETAKYNTMINNDFDSFSWPKDLLDSSKPYYDVFTHACMEWAGDLSDERIDRILRKEEYPDVVTLSHIVNALYGMNSPRFTEFAVFVGRNESCISIWHEVFSLLSKVKTEEVENFFVDFLINDDKLRRYLTKIADDYFVKN